MTEHEWMNTADLGLLHSAVQEHLKTDRKNRLFRVACCRALWADLTIKIAREATIAAEKYADGQLTLEQLNHVNVRGFVRFSTYSSIRNLRRAKHDPKLENRINLAAFAIDSANIEVKNDFLLDSEDILTEVIKEVAPALIRDILGNPFRVNVFNELWRDSNSVPIALAMYNSRDFTLAPILADALEEAGCSDATILEHLRDPGNVHVRGCWAIDQILGYI